MDLKALFTDERAVSPVVGVTMMIAIAVVLAAVVATLALGLGQGQGASPTASFEFENDSTDISVTHDGGDAIDTTYLQVEYDGAGTVNGFSGSDWTAGQTETDIVTGTSSGDMIRIVWNDPDSDRTAVLAKYEVR